MPKGLFANIVVEIPPALRDLDEQAALNITRSALNWKSRKLESVGVEEEAENYAETHTVLAMLGQQARGVLTLRNGLLFLSSSYAQGVPELVPVNTGWALVMRPPKFCKGIGKAQRQAELYNISYFPPYPVLYVDTTMQRDIRITNPEIRVWSYWWVQEDEAWKPATRAHPVIRALYVDAVLTHARYDQRYGEYFQSIR